MNDIKKRLANLSPKQREQVLEKLRQQQSISSAKESQVIPMISREQVIPLSFAQQRLWFIEKMSLSSNAYNMPLTLHLVGKLDYLALQKSINQIIARHETLRTTFSEINGTPVQIIKPPFELELSIQDLNGLTPSEQTSKLQQLLQQENEQRFNLEVDPPIRSQLFKLGTTEHILQITLHHIASDGWSLTVLPKELSAIYTATLEDKPSPLPELPIQYADFAVWQRNYLQGQTLETQLNYWKQKLQDLPQLQLPIDHPRPTVQTFNGASIPINIPAALTSKLRELTQKQKVTLFMTLLAGFKVLLYRYSGQEKIAVGSPIANRNRSEIEGMIGFFVNSLIMYTDMGGEVSFLEVLNRVRQTSLEAYANQDIPFEKLVEELQPERSLSQNPLFQVMFAVQQSEVIEPVFNLPNLEVGWYKGIGAEATVRVDLELHLWQEGEEIKGFCAYARDLFEPQTIKRMLSHYQTLLSAAVESPEQSINQLPLMTEAEEYQILVEWNNNNAGYPKDQCIHQLFEAQVNQTPNAVAVIFEEQQLTYSQLNRKANQLAHYLQTLGVKPEVLVGVCLERSLDAIIALLAILKAGGAYVPLDPSYPQDRLAYMLSDAQVPVLLTHKKVMAKLPNHHAQQICVDIDWESLIESYSSDNPISKVKPDNLAYVIYTSGSTGKPKGVQAPHLGTINRLCWMWATYPFKKNEVCCQKTALSFVDSVWEFFGGLLKGIPTVIIPDEQVKEPHSLVQILSLNKVSRIVLVPSLLNVILQADLDFKQTLSFLRYWVVSGERLDAKLCQKFHQTFPQSRLINLYGSSEVAGDVTYYETHSVDLYYGLDRESHKLYEVNSVSTDRYIAPQNPEQELLTEIWKEVLDIEVVGIRDNFFKLGGNQALANKIISYIQNIFGICLPSNLLQIARDIETLSSALINYETEPGKIATIASFIKQIQGNCSN